MGNNVYQWVTDYFIEELEKALKTGSRLPWQMPWAGGGRPKNWATEKEYQGVNLFLLRGSSEWVTFKQAQKAGGKINKGAKKDEDGEIEKIPMLKYFKVFKIEDTTLTPKTTTRELPAEPIKDLEKISSNYLTREGIPLNKGTEAFYSPSNDAVTVPPIEKFYTQAGYYGTLFHELGHSTGSEKRLKRNLTGGFKSKSYAREELVAEMTAGMILADYGIFDEEKENSAAYIQSWIKALKNDVAAVVWAGSRAEKAAKFIKQGIGG